MTASATCDYCHLPIPAAPRGESADEPLYCCFGCRLAAEITGGRGESGQATWTLTRLGVAVFLSMAVMMFAIYLYGQEIYDADAPQRSALSGSLTNLMRYLCLLFATPVFFLLGVPIFVNAWRQLRAGIVSMDALIVIGVGAAFVHSYIATLTDRGQTYYETACMILVLVTLGRWLEAVGKLKAASSVEALAKLMPAEATVERDGQRVVVEAGEVRVGDRVHVPAGQRIAADGIIETGRSFVDEQLLTGESEPVARGPGDAVRAGTLNVDGALVVRALAVGRDSAIGRLRALLDEARRSKGRYERLADRLATAFIPFVGVLAIAGAALGYQRGGADDAIMSSLAVLLIACPCALGIATPTAVWAAFGRAAAGGVLVRNGAAIEALADVRCICFDKTGTLTTGEPTVESFVTRNGEDGVLSLAAGLAQTSTHALSRGILAFARRRGVNPTPISDSRTIAGRGVLATIDAGEMALGSLELMDDRSMTLTPPMQTSAARLMEEGLSLSCMGSPDGVEALFGFSETLRPEAAGALESLRRAGYDVRLLTGDHVRRGEAIARALGVPVYAGLLPADKTEHVRSLRAGGVAVAMVGDGLNDAPALAAADVGIAMGCGADLTREHADVCLIGSDLSQLPDLFRLARRTVRTIHVNLFWACAYNAVGVGLALTGRLNPALAAAAMVLSSLFVVANSLRLGTSESARECR